MSETGFLQWVYQEEHRMSAFPETKVYQMAEGHPQGPCFRHLIEHQLPPLVTAPGSLSRPVRLTK